MVPQIYIFIGQSGSGKGTQVKLLKEKLFKRDPQASVLHLETGEKFRNFISHNSFTAKKTKALIEAGKLPPPFLGIHMWAHVFAEEYTGTGYVFIDGTPRVPDEVPVLLSAIAFYEWQPHVVYLDVSDEWGYQRIKARGRSDDRNEHDAWGRIEWFHQYVVPSIELLKSSPLVTFHSIQGEQSVEAVHKDVCRSLGIAE